MLRVRALTFGFGRRVVLENIDFDLEAGQFMSVLGPSGCGKTTLLNCISGFHHPKTGRIEVDGVDITHSPAEARDFGVVFQEYALFPHMTVFENIAFGLRARKAQPRHVQERVHELIELVGLSGFVSRYPGQLSGGQRQRVALARALAPKPKLLLLDEPLTALDRALRVQLQDELRHLHKLIRVSVIMVTHDPEEAMSLSDRIVLLGDGRIVQLGSPVEVYEEPGSPLAMKYLGRVNELRGRSVGANGDAIAVEMEAIDGQFIVPRSRAPNVKGNERVLVMLRPERLQVSPPSVQVPASSRISLLSADRVGVIRGQVTEVVHKGSFTDVVVALATKGAISVAISRNAATMKSIVEGATVDVSVPIDAINCFPAGE